ncbi:GGDEF domain-containing protein [Caldichromatium japonicum]|uniref:diguanylate cyclase n=1 Tax=Caldichromatium japonicum TaxID=2699430 RepID=A0A6G7VCS8_9GAMM|nr:GGDEF domain-containing protein [Caldichromatium japonicum]QIK37676.1 GGDEF domain-containing protein [Caldichromatium japonicum]
MKAKEQQLDRIVHRLTPRVEQHLYRIFGVLGLILLLTVILHWFVIFKPRLLAESEGCAAALAQSWAQKIELLIDEADEEAVLRTQLTAFFQSILELTGPPAGRPMIHRISLSLSAGPFRGLTLDLGTGGSEPSFLIELPVQHRHLLQVNAASEGLGRLIFYFDRRVIEQFANQLAITLIVVAMLIGGVMTLISLQIRRLLQWLHQGEENLRAVFEAAPFPMMLQVNEDKRLCWANVAAQRYLALHESPDGCFSSPIWEDLAQSLPAQLGEMREVQLDAGRRWVMVSAIPVSFSGVPSRIIGLADISALKAVQDELHLASITDPLTGLYNRRYLYQRLEQEIEFANRYAHPLSIILFDLDYFKQINDSFGHNLGDEVLVWISGILRSTIREVDIAGRHGGEEFLVILPHTDLEGAIEVAERLRSEIDSIEWSVHGLKVTISGGVAQYNGEPLDEFVHRADCKLLEAKESGRNRICIAEGSAPSLIRLF